jgi:ADP-ribose pyrophosphatase YjhB (NUDIX family)
VASPTSLPEFGRRIQGIEYKIQRAAYAIILDQRNRIALVRQRNELLLPGGPMLQDETVEQSIRRRVKEESGRSVRIFRHLGMARQLFCATSQHIEMWASFCTASFSRSETTRAEYEVEWLPVDLIAEQLVHECHLWAINRASIPRFTD